MNRQSMFYLFLLLILSIMAIIHVLMLGIKDIIPNHSCDEPVSLYADNKGKTAVSYNGLLLQPSLSVRGMTAVRNNVSENDISPLHQNDQNGSDVMIVAYMRSGSTFLGKLLGHRNDTFYWMEPLKTSLDWEFFRGRDLLCHNLYGTCRIIAEFESYHREQALQFLSDIYKCKLDNYNDKPTSAHFTPGRMPESWVPFKRCTATRNYSRCMHLLVNACKNSKHRVTKVIRIDIDGVMDMLNRNRNLKVIHIFRDPRGITNSRLRTLWYKSRIPSTASIELNIKMLCSRISNDLSHAVILAEMFPHRYKIVQYEDLGSSFDKASKLYQFLGMGALSENDIQLKNLFNSSKTTSSRGFHPYTYRTQMEWSIAQTVQKYCKSVFPILGQRIFINMNDYRNTSLNVSMGEFPFLI